MCVGHSLFNLCRCGCTEAEHEEVIDVLELAFRTSESDRDLSVNLSLPMKRGKCCGQRLKILSLEDIKAIKERWEELVLTEPCDCLGFDPVFKPLCPGIV